MLRSVAILQSSGIREWPSTMSYNNCGEAEHVLLVTSADRQVKLPNQLLQPPEIAEGIT